MLTRHNAQCSRAGSPKKQQGVVLVIALIVLVAMTLAGIALVRSVDTTNVIAGNLAFQQAATQGGDLGVEQAILWLEKNNNNSTLNKNTNNANSGYIANGTGRLHNVPDTGESWDHFWNSTLNADATPPSVKDSNTGNTYSYVIQRLCANEGSTTSAGCTSSSVLVSDAVGNSEESGEIQLNALSMTFYRITVRIAGPRSSVSYVQAMVAL